MLYRTLGLACVLAWTTPATMASECVYRCESNEIRFIPGQQVKVEIINLTGSLVRVERVLEFEPISLSPDHTTSLEIQVGIGDLSLIFWETQQQSVKARLHRPAPEQLRIELLPGGAQGDSVIHVVNDGRVLVY